MALDQSKPTGETQSSRRVKYGLNVTIAVIAVVLIVIIINTIAYRRLFRVRWDTTQEQRWSLSPQTRKVVKNLPGKYRMVVLLSEANESRKRGRGLIREYQFLSDQLVVDEIDPANEAHTRAFYADLLERYEDKLTPYKAAIQSNLKALSALTLAARPHLELLQQVTSDKRLANDRSMQALNDLLTYFARIESDSESLTESVTEALASALPDYSGAHGTVQQELGRHHANFGVSIQQFETMAEQASVPDALKEKLLQLAEEVGQTDAALAKAIEASTALEPLEGYNRLRVRIGPETVVLLGPKGKAPRVVELREMFKSPSLEQSQQGRGEPKQAELIFIGEEKITGALIAMSMTEPPLVVFVAEQARMGAGNRAAFSLVGERLRNLNFQVEDWILSPQPRGQFGQMQMPTPPGPPPEPKPGQKAVWIVPALPGFNPMQPTAGAGPAQRVVDHLKQRLEAGDSVMVTMAYGGMASGFMPDPISDLVKQWGLTAQLDRVILRKIASTDRRGGITPIMNVDQWPAGDDDLPITKALAGMPAQFRQASPLVIGAGDENTRIWPLVQITAKGLWAETKLERGTNPKWTQETAADSFTIAAAIEKGNNRMIVVCDPIWAMDQITGLRYLVQGGIATAYPGNAELFANSVFWLAGLDQLIAAGARSQDIRRIEPMSATGLKVLQWTLAICMPLVIALVGVTVGLMRRRE